MTTTLNPVPVVAGDAPVTVTVALTRDHTVTAGPVTVGFTHPAPGTCRITLTAAALAEPLVFHDYGELAVALHLAAQPLSRELTIERITELITHGATRVGVDQVRRYAREDRRANRLVRDGVITLRAWRAWRGEFWSSNQRAQLCMDLATRIGWAGTRRDATEMSA